MMYQCRGVRSLCLDGDMSHAILLDFDGVSQRTIESELRTQQRKRNLSDFTLAKTKHGTHAYCPTKVPLFEYKSIIEETSADKNLLRPLMGWTTPSTTLRFDGDKGTPTYLKTIDSPHRNARKQSLAHLHFLRVWFNLDISKYENTDGITELSVCTYKTQNG